MVSGRGEDTRRHLGERLDSVAEDAKRKAQEVARHVRGRLNDEPRSDSDDSPALPPKKFGFPKSSQRVERNHRFVPVLAAHMQRSGFMV